MSSNLCEICGLYKYCTNPMMWGQGEVNDPLVMFVATCPLWEEQSHGKYWLKSSVTLKVALEEIGINTDQVYYTSLLKCPCDNPTSSQVKSCQELLFQEIEQINPKIIVPMGNLPMKVLMGVTGITKHRGKAIEKGDQVYLPILHPSICARQPKHWDGFVADINTLKDLIENGMSIKLLGDDVDYRLLDTVDAVISELDRLEKEAEWITIDIETTGKNPHAPNSKIVTIALTDKERYGVCIPLYHRETPFKSHELGCIVKRLRKLLGNTSKKFVAQNAKFEIKWLEAVLSILVESVVFDTMLAHYIGVTEEQGTHDLKTLAWRYTDMGGYDNELDNFKKTLPESERENYDNIPLRILWRYNTADADCTHRLIKPLSESVDSDEKLTWVYDNIIMPVTYTLKDIEMFGMHVDQGYMVEAIEAYTNRLKELDEQLHSYPEILSIERERLELYELYLLEKKKPKEQRNPEIMKYEKYKKDGYKFNFNSVPQLQDLLFGRLKLPVVRYTDKNAPSTNEGVLETLSNYHDIPKIMLEYRKINTLNNMFIQKIPNLLDGEGTIHPSYLIHGTVTGRLSSENPNAQQFPRKVEDPWLFQYQWEIKKLFNSRFGEDGVILQLDYSQLELRVAAILSGDDFLLGVYRRGGDLHTEVASQVFKVQTEEVDKNMRTKAKKVNFGIVYGISAPGLASDPEVDMDIDEAQKFINEYFKIVPKLKKWIDNTIRDLRQNKYVRTLFGRFRRLPSIDSSDRGVRNGAEREGINAPVQGTGSDMTLLSLIFINNWLKSHSYKSRIFVTVHDSIGLDVYIPELKDVLKVSKEIMENLPMDFLKICPIVAEAELGYNYGELFELSDYSEIEKAGGVHDWIKIQMDKKLEKEKKKWEGYQQKMDESV